MIELFDTHVHLDAYEDDLDQVLERAKSAGVNRFLAIGASRGIESNFKAKEIAASNENVWFTAGVHPHDAKDITDLFRLEQILKDPKLRAIGETGLDYYRDWAPKDLQLKLFEAHLEVAKQMNLPVVIHSRDAAKDCLAVIKRFLPLKGVFHCFSDSLEIAKQVIDIGFYVSIPGSLTFKKADLLRETVAQIPLDRILLETDAPYLAPEPYRGKRNESSFMIYTATTLAKIKGETLELVANVTTKNARELFSV
jgi:TatD DNase family protein